MRALALALFVGASGATAQEPASDSDAIVVTATRSETPAFDTPAAIGSVDAEAIREAGPRVNLSESLHRLPGINSLDRQNYAQDLQLSIRGFGARSTFGVRGFRILVDGIPASMPDGQGQVSAIDLSAAERIEVLRGPLAQLYGNAAGGVLQVFTDPGGPPGLEGNVDFGSFDSRRYGFKAQSEGAQWRGALSASRFDTDGYRDHSAARREWLNAQLQWFPLDKGKLTFSGSFFDQPEALDPGGLSREDFERDPRQAAANALAQDARKSVRQAQGGLLWEHEPTTKDRLSARLYYGHRDLDQALAIPLAAQLAPTSSGGFIVLDRDYGGAGLQYTRQGEFLGRRLDSTVGIEAEGMQEHRRGFLNVSGARGDLKRDEEDRVWSAGIYSQWLWRFDPRWSALAGLRWSTVRFKVEDDFIVAGNPDDSGRTSFNNLSPVLGLTHHYSDKLNLYANYGRGFETPTFTELAYRASGSGLNLGLDAARSRHYEIGLKYRPAISHRFDAALFRIDTEDELIVESNSGGRSVYRNAGPTRRYGAELAYTGQWSAHWRFDTALTLLDARFRDGEFDRNRLPGTPDRQLYAALTWRPLQGFSVGAEAFHAGKLYVNDANDDHAEARTIFNLRAGWEHKQGPWSLGFYARLNNITDRDYAGSVIVNEFNGRYFEPAPGRNWNVGFSAKLDL